MIMISSKSETRISLQLTRKKHILKCNMVNMTSWESRRSGISRQYVGVWCNAMWNPRMQKWCGFMLCICIYSVKIPCSMKVSVSVSSSDWRGRHSLCSYRQLFTPPGLLGSPASLLAHSSNSWLPSSPVQQMWWYDPELVSWPWGGLAVGHCTEPHTHIQMFIS